MNEFESDLINAIEEISRSMEEISMSCPDPQALPKAINSVAYALRQLGNGNAATEMGAIENLANEIKDGSERIADALNAIATAIRSS